MALTLTAGYSFGSTELVTAAKLASLVTGATAASIDRTNFQSDTRPVTAKSSDLTSPVAGEIQARTDQFGIQVSDGTAFHDIPTWKRLINKTGATLTKGDCVIFGTSSVADVFTTASSPSSYAGEVGVLLEGASADERKTVRFLGYPTQVNIVGTATALQFLGLTTAGKAVPQALAAGAFGRVITGGTNSCQAVLFGIANSGATAIRVFSASGTWIKPSGLLRAKIISVGGGGGGGGGGNDSDGTSGGGGGGGGGPGQYGIVIVEAASLGATETVTIGTAGTGGASGNPGANGGTGGNSIFGSFSTALGGRAGVGGQNSTGGKGAGGGAYPPLNGGFDGANPSGGAGGIGGTGGGTLYGLGGTAGTAGGLGGAGGVPSTSAYGAGGGGGGGGGDNNGGAGAAGQMGIIIVHEA